MAPWARWPSPSRTQARTPPASAPPSRRAGVGVGMEEGGGGWDATGMRTSFRRVGDEVLVNGGKSFITNGDRAGLYLLFGKWEGIAGARQSISVLILEQG